MPKGIPKSGINKGWFKKGKHPNSHFKKGHKFGFPKGYIPWNKGKKVPVISKTLRKLFKIRPELGFQKGHKVFGGFQKGHSYGKRFTKGCLPTKTSFKKGHIPYSKFHPECMPKGKIHWNWQNGLSFEPYIPSFNQQLKEKIRVRDNFVCQLCGIPELELTQRLDIHHINYNKKNCKLDNLISLCRNCNSKVNKNRNYWKNYFYSMQTKEELRKWRRR